MMMIITTYFWGKINPFFHVLIILMLPLHCCGSMFCLIRALALCTTSLKGYTYCCIIQKRPAGTILKRNGPTNVTTNPISIRYSYYLLALFNGPSNIHTAFTYIGQLNLSTIKVIEVCNVFDCWTAFFIQFFFFFINCMLLGYTFFY